MTCHSLAKITLGALFVTLGGCKDSGPPVEPTANFPVPSSAATIYDRTSSSSIPGKSRYIVYDNGTFSLQYVTPAFGFFEYVGRYTRQDSAIAFQFDDNGGIWVADGISAGDSLTVKYNHDMLMSDFEDGVYTQSTNGSSNETGG